MTDSIRDDLQSALGATMSLGRELGGGGMSRVFLARDTTLGRDVVVKLLSPELAQELSTERFGREIGLAAALQHANLVPVLSAGVTPGGLPYYLMPFIEGASLRDLVKDGQPLPISDVLLVLGDVCRALTYAHGRGVVHRDIKPDNVMLSGGAALVTDFGIAKAMTSSRSTSPSTTGGTDSLTRMGTSLGTPAYMAPEQGAGDPDTDHRADLYALGAMAYELLTGQPPFGQRAPHAALIAHLSEAPVPVEQRRPDVPAPLGRLVMWCLEKDPANRPQQASDLQELLTDAALVTRTGNTAELRASMVGNRSSAAPLAPPIPVRRRSVAGIAALVAVIAGVGALGYRLATRTSSATPGPDKSLIAVMPFTVRDASLDVWREGMVDILARSLDGAGPLRTVSPSTSIAKSSGRGDVTTAVALGQTVGAGLVVFGELSPLGKDSVRARVAVVDVAANKVEHNIDVTGESSRIDAMADSVSLQVLRALGGDGLAGGARSASLGTASLTALKSYLVGQQYYRRGLVDSMQMAFESAVAADSQFALAWRGVASVYIRTGREAMPEAQAALDRAIRLRRGGGPRDSLLLHGDSLRLAVVRRDPMANDALADIPALTALFATLTEATRRYPSDAELWMELGDANFHFGSLAGQPDSLALAAFTRTIALDSMQFVPYSHGLTLAIRADRYRDAAAYARRMGVLYRADVAPYYRLLASVLDSAPTLANAAKPALDSLPLRLTVNVINALLDAPTLTPLVRRVIEGQLARVRANPKLPDAAEAVRVLATQQALLGNPPLAEPSLTLAERVPIAVAGLMPAEPVLAEARSLLATQPMQASTALTLFVGARDTAAIRAIARTFDSVDVSLRASGRAAAAHRGELARAYLTLAQGDSAGALQQLLSLPMVACGGTPCAPLATTTLLLRANRAADAARVIDRVWPSLRSTPAAARFMLLRAQAAEALNDRATARAWAEHAVMLWGDGNPAAQALVKPARDALTRLK
jgi:serine/threonine-protein kinase